MGNSVWTNVAGLRTAYSEPAWDDCAVAHYHVCIFVCTPRMAGHKKTCREVCSNS
jgi:hypothetical protein